MASTRCKTPFQECVVAPSTKTVVTVYRVEDSDGYGYKRSLDSNIGSVTCIEWRGYEERRPLPKNDGIDIEGLGEDWFFGFDSIESLKKWFFLNERNAGSTFGGKILVIEVDPEFVIYGGRQLVFHQDYAKTIATFPLNHYDTEEDRAVPFDDDDDEDDIGAGWSLELDKEAASAAVMS